MSEQIVATNGVQIWTEDFGQPSDPTVLLIMGAGAQGVRWQDPFCRQIVAGGRHVIRYDHRDTGLSSPVDFAANPYSVDDLALDALGVLDHYGARRAHIVGASMGGIVGQVLALDYSARVETLTLMMSTPAGADTAAASAGHDGPLDPEFAAPTAEVIAAMMAAVHDPSRSRDAEIEIDVEMARVLAGDLATWDAKNARAIAEMEYDRGHATRANKANHGMAVEKCPSRTRRLHEITAPTLVIHGTRDPILPISHGKALADGISKSRFVAIEGLGHELPKESWQLIVDEILHFTAP